MSEERFIERQIAQIWQDGRAALFRTMTRVLRNLHKLPLYALVILPVLAMRLIRPWLLVRLGPLSCTRIGHFASNTELYLCERDAGINVPDRRHVDLFYLSKPICNQQLATMWNRVLRIWPAWILVPICRVNRLIAGSAIHEIGNNTQHDRDVHNLLDRFPSHLKFTAKEEVRGEAELRAMGIPPSTPFVCLSVRDSAYLDAHQPGDWRYHDYRDNDVQNCVLAAEELANRGYFVVRMGAIVREAMQTTHPRVIDYAANGMRTDFMDIYLGAKCEFCISVGSGFDAVPRVFRRPVVFANVVPLGYMNTYQTQFLGISKHIVSKARNSELTLAEIFAHGVGFSYLTSDYVSKGVELVENSPEEIRDVVIEMAERLNDAWRSHEEDEALQKRFWDIFPTDAVDAERRHPLHGEIRSRFGAAFLRNNREWLQRGKVKRKCDCVTGNKTRSPG